MELWLILTIVMSAFLAATWWLAEWLVGRSDSEFDSEGSEAG